MKGNHQNMMSRNDVVSVKAAIYWQGTCKLQKFLLKASQRHDIIYGVVALAVLKKINQRNKDKLIRPIIDLFTWACFCGKI